LYAWLSLARRNHYDLPPKSSGVLNMGKRTRSRFPSTKLRIIGESIGLEGDALPAYCNANGVTVDELPSRRDLALTGIELSERDGLGVTRKEHDQKVAQLEKELRRKNDALAEAAALIVLQKKNIGPLGRRKVNASDRVMILAAIDEAVESGARQWKACQTIGLCERRLRRWRTTPEDARTGGYRASAQQLCEKETLSIIAEVERPDRAICPCESFTRACWTKEPILPPLRRWCT
jgi:hypothetical protein